MYSCVFLFAGCGGEGGDTQNTQLQEPIEDFSFPLHDIQNPIVGNTIDYDSEDLLSGLAAHTTQRKILRYKMLGVTGQITQATTVILTPLKPAPVGGYKTVVWAHGTTGVADICAPSTEGISSKVLPLIKQLLDEGYIVIAPDYEGLGTEGSHPFLNLKSEAFSITDAVVAAHQYLAQQNLLVSDQWLTVGHSQGGQAALGVSQYHLRAQLNYKGSIAIAPASNLNEILNKQRDQAKGSKSLIEKTKIYTTLNSFAALGIAGMQGYNTGLTYADVININLVKSVQIAERDCFPAIVERLGLEISLLNLLNSDNEERVVGLKNNFNKIPAFKKFLERDSQPLRVKVDTPIIIYQGSADTTVPKYATDLLVDDAKRKGTFIDYRTDDDKTIVWDHSTVLNQPDAFFADIQRLMPTN